MKMLQNQEVIEILSCIKEREITTVEHLRSVIESSRRTHIQIVETGLLKEVSICGLWAKKDGLDIIFHAATESSVYRDQILLHEFSHMILNHESNVSNPERSLLQSLLPDLDPSHFLLRTPELSSPAEEEAEQLAYLLAAQLRWVKQSLNRFDNVFG